MAERNLLATADSKSDSANAGAGMKLRFFDRWREQRETTDREATMLITFLGDMAYTEARHRARVSRQLADQSGYRLWSKVAVTVAGRTGYEIGLKAADRYEEDASSEGRAQARHRHEVAVSTRAILAALAAIARGTNVKVELHNVSAHVRNAEALVAVDAAVLAEGVDVFRTAAELADAADRSGKLIRKGLYPPELEAAGQAVERWRLALLKAAPR